MSPLVTPYIITLRHLVFFIVYTSIGLAFGGYLLFQSRFLLQGPIITLTEEPGVEHSERTVILRGTVQNITHLTLNGRQIFTNEAGFFEEVVFLENGYTITRLAATDRYGAKTEVVREFVYVPAFTSIENT